MAIELERKFLVDVEQWNAIKTRFPYKQIKQLYVAQDENGWITRVRVLEESGVLTIKGPRTSSGNLEFEYVIPKGDAEAMFSENPGPRLIKNRYEVPWENGILEVDEFLDAGSNGLVLAEWETSSYGKLIEGPSWLTQEVTDDESYRNDAIAKKIRDKKVKLR